MAAAGAGIQLKVRHMLRCWRAATSQLMLYLRDVDIASMRMPSGKR
jgi:hypothetical protein